MRDEAEVEREECAHLAQDLNALMDKWLGAGVEELQELELARFRSELGDEDTGVSSAVRAVQRQAARSREVALVLSLFAGAVARNDFALARAYHGCGVALVTESNEEVERRESE